MKMTQADFERLQNVIERTLKTYPNARTTSDALGISYTRFIWNAWNTTMDITMRADDKTDYEFMRGLYGYLNDDNIETALKRIIPE